MMSKKGRHEKLIDAMEGKICTEKSMGKPWDIRLCRALLMLVQNQTGIRESKIISKVI